MVRRMRRAHGARVALMLVAKAARGPPLGARGPPLGARGPPLGARGPPLGARGPPLGARGPPLGARGPPLGADRRQAVGACWTQGNEVETYEGTPAEYGSIARASGLARPRRQNALGADRRGCRARIGMCLQTVD